MQGVEFEILALDVLHVAVEVVERRADHRAEAAVDVGRGVGVVVEIHVKARRDAGGQILEDTELRKVVQHLRRELRLMRENLLVQPVVQRHVVRAGAQEGHGRVRVRVFEAGDQQAAFQVDLPLEGGQLVRRRADMADTPAVGPDLVLRHAHLRCKAQDPSVVKPNHDFSLSSLAHISSWAMRSSASSSGSSSARPKRRSSAVRSSRSAKSGFFGSMGPWL